MTDTVERCTAEQAAAIVTNGHTLLEANAGTGKTTTVVWKMLWHLGLADLVQEDGIPLPPCPDGQRLTLNRIAAITFTEKAAYDIKRKLRREIAKAAPHLLWEIDRAALGTIHSFSGELLREHALRFGIDPGFTVLDERESRLELEEIAREVFHRALNEGDGSAARLLTEFSLDGFQYQNGVFGHVADVVRDFRWHRERYHDWMEQGRLHRDLLERVAGCWDGKDDPSLETAQALLDVARRTLEEWEEYLERENVRDFDALILDCRDRLLSPEGAHALAGIRERFGLFIIDEFQDTDSAQRDIAFAIAGIGTGGPAAPAGPQLFMVGDPKQSIYRFRGADIAVWNEVIEQVGSPLTLSRNFRSDPLIVDYVNRACRSTMMDMGKAVDRWVPESRVEYRDLVAGRQATGTAGMEWLDVSGKAEERRELEAEMVAARIRDMVVDRAQGDLEGIRITDPDTGLPRDCEYRDVAILVRARTGVECYSQALARYGIPFYLAGDAGLTGQLEILDLLNLLQLLVNPQDDLAALAWLRSPFVGLRDETLARIRLRNSRRPLLWQASDFADSGDWFPAPEHPDIETLEASALRDGIRLIRDLLAVRSRVPLDQLAREALERSGYPLHLLLLPRPEPRLANLQRFLRVLADYRTHTVGSFLELWERWKDKDLGIPQAPLYSRKDNVVTISTVHGAKGLEWPVVFLLDLEGTLSDRMSNTFWSDRTMGPVFAPSQKDRGRRTGALCERNRAESLAEESRVFYVAATRARDRLVLSGPREKPKGYADWALRGLDENIPVTTTVPTVAVPPLPPEPSLAWLDRITGGAPDPLLALPLPAPPIRYTRSASELRAGRGNIGYWHMVYEHGVVPQHRFVGHGGGDGGLPADLRGTLIHSVLERVEEAEEIAALLDVAVGSLDSPELEEQLVPGSRHREDIEREIRQVVTSDQWRWYVEGDHWRELWFVQFRTPRKWRVGAFDLYRPGDPALIVDFKTSKVDAAGAAREAAKYAIQAAMYRTVAAALGSPAEVQFHFTGPNVVVRGQGTGNTD